VVKWEEFPVELGRQQLPFGFISLICDGVGLRAFLYFAGSPIREETSSFALVFCFFFCSLCFVFFSVLFLG